MNRILVIRGGAIGDFILTLPAIKALRDANPQSHIEILGYKQIAGLAENRFYAQRVCSIESASLAPFFAKNTELPPDLAEYFAGFDLILSYLYDADDVFEANLKRSGAKNIVRGPAKIGAESHAGQQLARPLEKIGIGIDHVAPALFPSSEDRHRAAEFLRELPRPRVAFHPGSGSEKKNWPVGNWLELGNYLLANSNASLVIVSGEGDENQIRQLELTWRTGRARFAKSLPLTDLVAVLEGTVFVGHDSGISHLAAAAGANCILLFGSTDPAVWAPLNKNSRVLRAPEGELQRLGVDPVRTAVDQELMRIGIRT